MDAWDKSYVRPTATDLTSDPGYLARMKAGEEAAGRSAAARGTLLTGGFQKGLAQANQDYASNEYQRLADRSLGEYMNAFNTFTTDKGRRSTEFGNTYNRALGEYGQRFNIDQANQLNKYGVVTGNFGMGETSRMNDQSILSSNRNFGLAEKGQNFSIFDTNRAYDANRSDTGFNQRRSTYNDYFDQSRLLDRDRAFDDQWLGLYGSPTQKGG